MGDMTGSLEGVGSQGSTAGSSAGARAGAGPAACAERTWTRLAARFLVVVALVGLDLWSKQAVFAWTAAHPERLERDFHGHARLPIADDWLALMPSLNPGMAWGFNRLDPHVLVYGRVAAVLFLLVLVARSAKGRRTVTAALILILAGALGNLHDNLLTTTEGMPFGSVRDFIDVYFPRWDWHFPTFNVADSCITIGAVLLFLASLRGAKKTSAGASAVAPERA
jgi:signal peptidase II